MRALLALALAALLAACAQTPPPAKLGGVSSGGAIVAATLSIGRCELLPAAALTDREVLLAGALRLAEQRRITRSTAERVLALADTAKRELLGACQGEQLNPERLRRGEDAVAQMRSLLREESGR